MARTWTISVTGNSVNFDTYRVSVVKKGLKRTMLNKSQVRQPILARHIRHIVRVLDKLGKQAKVIKAFIFIAFCTALRQSNLLLRTTSSPLGHVLLVKEVKVIERGLSVLVRSTKTTTPRFQTVMVIAWSETKRYCPVVAWLNYRRSLKRNDSLSHRRATL